MAATPRDDSMMVIPPINTERLLADLRKLRSFGAHGHGVVRPALSPIDIESRHWLVERMTEAGLGAAIDGLGTVYGRSPNPGPALLIGSHSDTQPTGGWLDGAMGVIYGIEIARALREAPETRDLAVDVASWIDEEGAFGSFIGSRAFCGEDMDVIIASARNDDGLSLRDALAAAGILGRPLARFAAGRYAGYLEPHIEQGGHLEETGHRIGVVTAIVGIREFRVAFCGQQNHAGTTPMARRKDAGAALMAFAHRLNGEFAAVAGPRSVWTIGRVELHPGYPSIIPGRAEFLLQFRDADAAVMDRFEAKLKDLAAAGGPVAVAVSPFDEAVAPTVMDAGLQHHLAAAAERHAPGKWVHMPSAAGHDAQVIGLAMPAAMLFVPSIGGISHDFAEDTADVDIALGCQVAATAAASILKSA